jgi:AraC-like DNA-binding protein
MGLGRRAQGATVLGTRYPLIILEPAPREDSRRSGSLAAGMAWPRLCRCWEPGQKRAKTLQIYASQRTAAAESPCWEERMVESMVKNSPVSRADTFANEPDIIKLAGLVGACSPRDGWFELSIPGVCTIRRSQKTKELTQAPQRPVLCIVAQGAKRVMLGQEVYSYDPSHMLIFSVDLPVATEITRASHAEPYLCFVLELNPRKIAELVLKVNPSGPPRGAQEIRGLCVCQVDIGIVNAAGRLLELTTQSGDAELLAPLVIEEILIRLLRSPVGARVAQIGLAESSVHGIAKAVAWLRANFSKPMKVADLAEMAHMSISSFHQHFKTVTSVTPLQYQKVLRLQEARRLLLSTTMGVSAASWHVGYQSASQFSREYARFFGSAPNKDIARLKEQGFTAVED